MTAWRNTTIAQLQKRGLVGNPGSTGRATPARAGMPGKHVSGGQGMLQNILGVALQDAFPGVFAPIPALGIHWGNEALKLGVNACGWAYAGYERHGWTVIPCTPAEITGHMPKVLQRVKNYLQRERQ